MARLCAAGIQLREQIDDDYPDRDRKSDGWIADARHLAKGSSDHIPVDGIVRALDIDADLSAHKEEATAKELWSRLHEYLTTLVDRLEKKQKAIESSASGDKTKAGQLHESHLENGVELCSLLTRLNVMNDPTLEAARKHLEEALSGVTIKDLRTSEGVRNDVKARVQDILGKFDW